MTIVEMSAGGAVLIAVILLLRWCLLDRLPKWTFLLLWAVALCRLLVPFTLPSQLSVYTGAARIAEVLREEKPIPEPAPAPDVPQIIWPENPTTSPGTLREDPWTVTAGPPAQPEREPVSPLAVVWLTGTALCGVFFGAAYLWTLRRFWDAVPAETDFLTRWREEHPTLRPVQIKVSGAVNAPVAYGLIRPVILLPENTDWTDEGQLTYILTHEYVHIRRGDLLWKLLLTAALCVHWFNPLVWVMYFRANRDLELACDEAVVRTLGLDSRKGYAYALLSAAESGFSPLCLTYTTKNHMEERIRAIMKMKKKSVAAILTAALLVAGVTAVFATSKAPEPKDISDLPSAVMTNTDPKPAPGDKSAPDDRVHPAAPADTSTPDVSRVHPITGQPAGTSADTPSQTDPKNRWNVPANPIPGGTDIPVADREDMGDLIAYLRLERGYTGYFVFGTDPATGSQIVTIGSYTENDYVPKDEVKIPEELLPDGHYPVNSRGETYGNAFGTEFLGYLPDLVGVQATNGKAGYALRNDYEYFGYTGKTDTLEEMWAFIEWQNTQPRPITYPVYDVNRDNIIGYFEVSEGISSNDIEGMDLETAREEIKNNRWGVPANPIPEGTEIRTENYEDTQALLNFLYEARGMRGGDLWIKDVDDTSGAQIVGVSYSQTKQEEESKVRLANGYPVNAKGETYGTAFDRSIVGYKPDLIAVVATNGKSGYILKADDEMFDEHAWAEQHGGDPSKFDEWVKILDECREWKKTQPYIVPVPVYDVDRTKVVGYFNKYNDDSKDYNPSREDIELELKTVEDQMRRNMGLSEEEIAKELEALKQFKGWS